MERSMETAWLAVAQPWRSVMRWKRASTSLRSMVSRERESQSPKHTLRFVRLISTVRGFRLGLARRESSKA